MSLEGRVVVVTGSTTGIGKAIAKRCVAENGRVLVHGRDADRGHALANELGEQAVFHQDELTDPASAGRIVEAALESFGRIDAIVNNAAWVVRSDLESTDVEMFDRIMAINVRAPLLLIQAALPHLVESGGCVANVGSVNSLGGEGNLLAYSVSKGALLTMSKNLANALSERRVRVFHFNVGWVLTENEYHYKMDDGFEPGWPDRLTTDDFPIGRMTMPEEVANVVTFLASPAASLVTGINLVADNGFTKRVQL